MRIAYDHQIFGLQEYGGISRYFLELADNISRIEGCDARIISPLHINSYLAAAPHRVQVVGHRIPALRGGSYLCSALNRLLVPYWMPKFHPDLVHETYYSANTPAPQGCKVVVTVHDMIPELFPEQISSGDAISRNKEIAVGRADHVICVSEQTRRDLIDLLSVNPDKISVIYHGVTPPEPAVGAPRKNGRPYLLYVGSRTGYKNFEGLLGAYTAVPGLQDSHDIVAFGGGVLKPNELRLLASLGIRAENVHQIGGGDSVLAGLYRQADLFVYPSLYEGFGMPPLEAMSFGCPVVCGNVSAIPEVVGDAAVLFDPSSFESLGLAIERVLNDRVLRESKVSMGRERVKQFTWERCAYETLGVYRKILA